MIDIYVDEISERCIYVFDFIFKSNGFNYRLTNDEIFFANTTTKKFNFSARHFDNVVQFVPTSLLFEEKVIVHRVSLATFEDESCFAFDNQCDPFAAIFFVLTRMEEYYDFLPDKHGRFRASKSAQAQFGCLQKVVCDRWSRAIINWLYREHVLHTPFTKKPTTINPTFDIDNTYAYKLKDGVRSILSRVKDVSKMDKNRLTERKRVISNEIPDPYDTFDAIESISQRGFQVNMFWLLGNYSTFDKNISHLNDKHAELIRRMGKSAEIGIHPSYKSNIHFESLSSEIDRLKIILNKPIENSRQHFLKLVFPATYKNLISNKIKHDFTMGYASEVGFRAGTARPYLWFDLEKNYCTDLTIHPFAYMDGTLLEYQNYSISEAKKIITKLYEEVEEFGGSFSFLWHNETIGDYGKWKGWSEVLEFSLRLGELDREWE